MEIDKKNDKHNTVNILGDDNKSEQSDDDDDEI